MPNDKPLSKDQLVEKLNGVLKLVDWQGKLLHNMLHEIEAGCVADDPPARQRKQPKADPAPRKRPRKR